MAAMICTCGLLQVRKAGTSEIEGRMHCNRCGLPLEFDPADLARTTASAESSRPSPEQLRVERAKERLQSYCVLGAVLYVLGSVFGYLGLQNIDNDLPDPSLDLCR